MAVDFPSPAVQGQLYPNTAAGDPPLDNGRVYIYDAAAGIWNLKEQTGSISGDFVKIPGDTMTGPLAIDAKDSTTGTDNLFSIEGDQANGGTGDRLLVATRTNSSGDQLRYYGPVVFDKEVTTKEYVDERDDILQQEVIKVQEEINAIIPQLDRGIWKDSASASPSAGHFSMRLQGGNITQDYTKTDINTIIIHKEDQDGGIHGFVKEKPGDLIQLFDVIDENYGLFEIISKDTSNANYASFEVQWLQGLGETHVDDDVLIRISEPPSGGTASEFVKKVGDDMSGPIEIDDPTVITDANHLVNKGYVDDEIAKVGGISGGCIELNGGNLCATPPMPEFIDLVKAFKVTTYLTGCWTGVYSSTQYCYGSVDLKRKVRYVAVNGNNSGQSNGDIIEVPFSAGNDWSKGTKTNISMGYHLDRTSFSPNGKYFAAMHWQESSSSQSYWWMNYTVDISRNSDREMVRSETQAHTPTTRTASLGQLCWWDDEHFIFSGYGFAQSSSQKYICEIVYGTITTNNDGSMRVTTSKLNPGNVTGNSDASSSNHQQYIFQVNGTVYLRSLNDIYKLTSFEKKSSDWVKVGTFSSRLEGLYYYSELKRYWYSYNGYGYLSRQTEEELNVNTFDNAIRFAFDDHVFSDGTTYNHSPKLSASHPPFMYGTQLIVPTSYHGTKTINGVSEKPYRGFYVYKGGETTGDLFKGDPLNQMGNGYDFNANQSPGSYAYWYSQPSYSDSSLVGYIDNTKIVTNYAINIETDTPQPYVHDLTWNGISILNETDDDDDGTVTTIGYAGISNTGNVTATSTYRESDVEDGYFYTVYFNNNNINDPDPTNGNYNGLFLTPGWIKHYAAIPSDVTDVQAYDLSGDWENQNSGSNSRTVSIQNVKGHTFNNIEGILLKFNNTTTIGSSSNNRTWKPTIPVAVRYVTTFGGGDLPML